MFIPPPWDIAVFPLIVQVVRVGEESELHTPPPTPLAIFPLIVQVESVGEE